ncbi:MAG: type II toxin-antitoxin system RelE/ParE family toxin [Oscillospiraceae bacterium]|nr:type II toxin-antitoxin system RelE/ParE family toxin [Oscillospiraceae bacterium]
MKLNLTEPAFQDLKDIRTYISETLFSPKAAEDTVQKIIKTYKKLKLQPYMGASLRSKLNIDTPIRRLVCGDYLVFYEVKEIDDCVDIIRIIRGNRDYIKMLF